MWGVEFLPKVSVCVITYNHGEWLRECLQSIVEQVTNFDFEIIVGDDCSNDENSKFILTEFSDKYPSIITPLFREKNMGGGGTQNLLDVVRRAKGAYIAHIDGDDRMLPGKLQKQADFLDENPDCSFVAHDLSVFDAVNGVVIAKSFFEKEIPRKTSIEYLLFNHCFFGHSSKMYRKSALITTDSQLPIVDFYFHVEHSASGKIGYINEVLGEYRKSSASNSSSSGSHRDLIFDAYERAFQRALDLKFNKETIQRGWVNFKFSFACDLLRARNYASFNRCIKLLSEEWRVATFKHKVLSIFSFSPGFCEYIINIYDLAKKKARKMMADPL
jgi:glycosyltransferase involved in cell wall biosynthesis